MACTSLNVRATALVDRGSEATSIALTATTSRITLAREIQRAKSQVRNTETHLVEMLNKTAILADGLLSNKAPKIRLFLTPPGHDAALNTSCLWWATCFSRDIDSLARFDTNA